MEQEDFHQLLANPPSDVDLTLVGGQALMYWTLQYKKEYPELLPDEIIAATFDVDFVVDRVKDCEVIAEHWKMNLVKPGMGDATPEVGVLFTNKGFDNEFRVDLLDTLCGMDKHSIKKNRTSFYSKKRDYPNYHVLTPWGVLLNRMNNMLVLRKYQGEYGQCQMANTIGIMKASVINMLDSGKTKEAQSVCSKILKLSHESRYGMKLFLKHNVDLLSIIPKNDPRFTEPFKSEGLIQGLEKIKNKRERLLRAKMMTGEMRDTIEATFG